MTPTTAFNAYCDAFAAGDHLAMAGLRLSSSDELQLHSNSLGRICFIAALTVMGLPLLKNFRPRIPVVSAQRAGTGGALYFYAYPVIFLATMLPAILAATELVRRCTCSAALVAKVLYL